MKRFGIVVGLLALPLLSLAQASREIQLGVNLLPAFGKTLEITAERRFAPRGAWFVNGGYTFDATGRGCIQCANPDQRNLRTGGGFLKIGAKLIASPFARTRPYLGGGVLVSAYRKSAEVIVPYYSGTPPRYVLVETQGTAFTGFAHAGLTWNWSPRLASDAGAQVIFPWGVKRDTFRWENWDSPRGGYRPGIGTWPLQAIFTVKYRLGVRQDRTDF